VDSLRRNAIDLRSSLDDLLRRFARVLFKVLVEEFGELVDFVFKVGATSPRFGRVEELVWHARAALWHVQVEGVVCLVLCLGELAAMDGVEDGARVLERAALASSGGASAHPAGVEEPGIGLVMFNLVS